MTARSRAGSRGFLVRLATRPLPAAQGERYRQELLAELYELPRREQLGFAVRALSRSLALRAAVSAPAAQVAGADVVIHAPSQPLACRMHLYHRWKVCTTDDGRRYLACAKCGKDKEGSGDTIGYIAPGGF